MLQRSDSAAAELERETEAPTCGPRDDYGNSMDANTTTTAAIMPSLGKLKLSGNLADTAAVSLLASLFTGVSAVKHPTRNCSSRSSATATR